MYEKLFIDIKSYLKSRKAIVDELLTDTENEINRNQYGIISEELEHLISTVRDKEMEMLQEKIKK